jgi:hypothetical protein
MDALLAEDLRQQVYTAKVNAAIPWAGIQTDQWVGGDPNPGTAFRVAVDKRSYTVENGYWYYKPIARAGQPGMKVAAVSSSDAAIRALAFASNGTRNPDAFVIINTKRDAGRGGAKAITIQVQGTSGQTFTAYRTAGQGRETYAALGKFTVTNGILPYTAPDNSVTVFFAV